MRLFIRGLLVASALVLVAQSRTPAAAPEAGASAPLFRDIPSDQSGVTIRHPILPDHPRAYLYVSGFACGGVCIGDVNGDARLDLFFTSGPETNRLYVQTDQPFVFKDATDDARLSGKTPAGEKPWAAGAALVDLDHDGSLDIYICNYEAPNQLLINDGHGRFTEQAHEWGLDLVDASLFPAFMDIDGSGELALYLVTNRYERPAGRPPQPPIVTVDGRPRIAPAFEKYYALKQSGPGRYQVDFTGRPDRLLVVERNAAGRRTYRDVTRAAGILPDGAHGLSATWFDYDNDGRPDLYVCNDFADPDCLYHNEGPGSDGIVHFKNVIADVTPITTWSSMGSDAADIDNDGLMDLAVGEMASTTHYQEMVNNGNLADRLDTLLNSSPRQTMRNMLFLNTGMGRFLESGFLSGVACTDWTWAVKLADFDNDGRPDMFVTNGVTRNFTDADLPFTTEMYVGHTDWDLLRNQPPRKEENLAFRNVDGLRFENVSKTWGVNHLGMSYAAAYGDLDRDGDLDLVACNLDETVSIYRNEENSGRHWLEVQLLGSKSSTQGWGAVGRVKTASGWRMRQMNPATGFLSCNEPALHFGLGDDGAIEAVEVHWPSGHVQRVEGPAVDHLLTLTEPEGDALRGRGPAKVQRPLLARVEDRGLNFRHRETPYDDFRREPLLPAKLSQLGPGVAVGDADGDGDDDIYFGGAAGQAGELYVQDAGGAFAKTPGPWDADAKCEDMGAVWFDADGDGKLDLYVASGGVEGFEGDPIFQDRLYRNKTDSGGPPKFIKASPESLPVETNAGSAVCAADFDGDGDLDLFVGSRSIPGRYPQTPRSMLLRNESTSAGAKFVDVAGDVAPELASAGLINGAIWSDVDADGRPDLLVTPEWGPVKFFHNQGGYLVDRTTAAGLGDRVGWWHGIAAGDFDSDGSVDYLVTNVGLNTKYGDPSRGNRSLLFAGDMGAGGGDQLIEAKLRTEKLLPVRGLDTSAAAMPLLQHKFPSHRAYAAATLSQIYGAGTLQQCLRLEATEFRSGVLINRSTSDGLAFEWQPLADIAQISPGYGIAVADFDGDGRVDAAMAQNLVTREPETGLWRGGLSQLLRGTASQGLEAIPARASGVVISGDAKGAATMDFNGDARPDLLVAQNNDAAVALQNKGAEAWLALRLLNANGTPAIGTKVTVHFASGRASASELCAGSGYLSQSAAEVFVGQGDDAPVSADIRWSSGETQNVTLRGKAGRLVIANQAVK